MKFFALLLVFTTGQLFAQTLATSRATAANVNLPPQQIQPSDLLGIDVYDSPELTRTVRVAEDGTIGLPLLKKRVKVEGLMPLDAESAIATALKEENIIVDPVVTVVIAEYHKNLPISVVGAVKTPVTFEIDRPVTLLDAISKAGGVTSEAGPDILITNPQQGVGVSGDPTVLVRRVAVQDLMNRADAQANITLVGGEQIRIPEVGSVFVLGNVKKPGAVSVRDGGKNTTVLRVLARCEGLLPNAKNEAFIYRREAGGTSKNQIVIPLDKIVNGKAPDVALMADDILYIPDNRARRETLAVLQALLTMGAGAVGALTYAELAH